MKYYGKAQQVAQSILDKFQAGDVPKALAHIFINRKDHLPMNSWSWANQLICAMNGCTDARGFRQWEKVNRRVIKGQNAQAYILGPLKGKKIVDDEERYYIYGFKSIPVFDISQTEGEPLPKALEDDVEKKLSSLPYRNVAEHWGLAIETYAGRKSGPRGFYQFKEKIALGVENLATWTHELCHAADDKNGKLVERGQYWSSETVAQLGGAILLLIAGYEYEADLGGCWKYINSYAKDAGIDTIKACMQMLDRTCAAVSLILDTSNELINSDIKQPLELVEC